MKNETLVLQGPNEEAQETVTAGRGRKVELAGEIGRSRFFTWGFEGIDRRSKYLI